MAMSTKYYNIDSVGEVKITKRQNAVNVRLSIDQAGLVRVSIPRSYSFSAAVEFVKEKADWIIERQNQRTKRIFKLGENIKTRSHVVNVSVHNKPEVIATQKKNAITVKVGAPYSVEQEKVQHFIKRVLTEIYRLEAKAYLPKRVNELANQYGFRYENVFIKNLKSKWGSCSSKKNINLNVHVMTLPDKLIDYIILHELAHTIELNHSQKFWNILDQIYGNSKAVDNEIKKYSVEYVK